MAPPSATRRPNACAIGLTPSRLKTPVLGCSEQGGHDPCPMRSSQSVPLESEPTFDGGPDPHAFVAAAWVALVGASSNSGDADIAGGASEGKGGALQVVTDPELLRRSLFQTRSLSRQLGMIGSRTSSRCGRQTAQTNDCRFSEEEWRSVELCPEWSSFMETLSIIPFALLGKHVIETLLPYTFVARLRRSHRHHQPLCYLGICWKHRRAGRVREMVRESARSSAR